MTVATESTCDSQHARAPRSNPTADRRSPGESALGKPPLPGVASGNRWTPSTPLPSQRCQQGAQAARKAALRPTSRSQRQVDVEPGFVAGVQRPLPGGSGASWPHPGKGVARGRGGAFLRRPALASGDDDQGETSCETPRHPTSSAAYYASAVSRIQRPRGPCQEI